MCSGQGSRILEQSGTFLGFSYVSLTLIFQVHDSFRAFRSQNVHLGIVLETKPTSTQSSTGFECPVISLYGSTLRWIENLKMILSGVTRPTRRGQIFKNVRPRKIQLSRHYKKVHLLMGLHKFQVCYWMSFAMQRGFELLGGRLSSSSGKIVFPVPNKNRLHTVELIRCFILWCAIRPNCRI